MLLEIINPAILRKDTSQRDALIAKRKVLEHEIAGLTSCLNRIADDVCEHGASVINLYVLEQEDDLSYLKSLAEVELAKTAADITLLDDSVKFTARTLVSCT